MVGVCRLRQIIKMDDQIRKTFLLRYRQRLYGMSPNDREVGNQLSAVAEELKQIYAKERGLRPEPLLFKQWRAPIDD